MPRKLKKLTQTQQAIYDQCAELKAQEHQEIALYTAYSELSAKHQTSLLHNDRRMALDRAHDLARQRRKLARQLPLDYLIQFI